MYKRLLILALTLAVGAATAMAQAGLPARDNLAGLKNALEGAGAAALTSAQESSINTLITEFRNAHKPTANSALQTARAAYENAILSGDSATAASQAAVIGNAQAAEMAQHESDVALFAIQVASILKTQGSQLDALISKLGSGKAVRLLLGLAGGPGGFGPGGPGRGGPGPQGMRRGAPPEF